MSSAPASPAPEQPKSKKSKLKLVLIGAACVMFAAGSAAGAWFYLNDKQGHEAGAAEQESAAAPKQRAAPTYLALETMVVNLADPGGERVAQIGVTLDLDNEKTVAQIKTVLPAIRSRVLMLASQRTSEELLKRDGKEKLSDDIAQEVTLALGYEVYEPRASRKPSKAGEAGDEEPPMRKKRRTPPSPVYGVLFSNFIVQ